MLIPGRKLLVVLLVGSVAPVSAERFVTSVDHGPDCPYERARLAAAHSAAVAAPAAVVPLAGSRFALDHAPFFAP